MIFKIFPVLPGKYFSKILKYFGVKIGNNVTLRSSVDILYPFNLEVGDNTRIEADCYLGCWAPVKIGKNVAVALRTVFMPVFHSKETKAIFYASFTGFTMYGFQKADTKQQPSHPMLSTGRTII